MRKFVCFLITIIIVVAGATFTFGETDNENKKVYYEQVEIKSGDTLWSVSQKYKNEDEATKDYVEKIMKFNNMKSDKIKNGQKIVVIISY